ncbi:MAG: KTSC domain-containing protein [Lachnospiraceae bacterium]|nr:KTSC domain-containing protein [Lachnospiraceae bacterium]
MERVLFGEKVIASAGYDPLTKVLEVEFTRLRKVCLYLDVDEDDWYGLKYADYADNYFRKHIRCKYLERRL